MSSAVADDDAGHGIIRELRDTFEESDVDTTDQKFHQTVKRLEGRADNLDGKLRAKGYELETDSPVFDYSDKTREAAERLETTWKGYVEAAVNQPSLFTRNPETIEETVDELTEKLDISKNECVEAALEQPSLFYQSPETVEDRIVELTSRLEISEKDFIKAGLKQPQLFYQKPETLEGNILDLTDRLDISTNKYIEAALERPGLFTRKPESIEENIIKLTDNLEIPRDSFIEAALKHPQLFYQKPETLQKNILDLTENLEIPKNDYIQAALNTPSLFTRRPETLQENFNKLTSNLKVSKDAYMEAALVQPPILTQRPETIERHVEWFYALEREEVISIPSNYGDDETSPVMDYMTNQPYLFCLADENFELRLYNVKTLNKDAYMKNLAKPKYKVLDELEQEHGIAEEWLETSEINVKEYQTVPDNAEIGELFSRNLAYDQEIISEYLQELEKRENVAKYVDQTNRPEIPDRIPETKELMSTID